MTRNSKGWLKLQETMGSQGLSLHPKPPSFKAEAETECRWQKRIVAALEKGGGEKLAK